MRQGLAAASGRVLRESRAWSAPALAAVSIATVEHWAGGESAARVLADAWEILVVGMIAASSLSPPGIPGRFRGLMLVSLLPAIYVSSRFTFGPDMSRWDWLYISGIMTWLAGIGLSENMDVMINQTLRSLADSEVLQISNRGLRMTRRRIRRDMRRYQAMSGSLVGAAVLASWIIYGWPFLPYLLIHNPAAVIFDTLAAVIAGQRLGCMVAYGSAWRFLRARPARLSLMPGHPDGTAGLAAIGRFYFRQALIAGLPAAYLAIWWFLIPILPRSYLQWRSLYLGLLAGAIAFEVLAFFLPMRAIHQVMLAERRGQAVEADRLAARIAKVQELLVRAADSAARDDLSKELAILLDWYKTLRSVPNWPVSQSVRRWFTVSNAALFVPFLSYLFGNPALWQQIASLLGGLKH